MDNIRDISVRAVPTSGDILKPKQLHAALLRAKGISVERTCREIGIVTKTWYRWLQLPAFREAIDCYKKEWVQQYENAFTNLLPKVVNRHSQLLDSKTEAIQMRAVDSCHQHYSRNIREQEVKSEVQELKEMVRILCEQLAQQRAAG